MARRGRRQALVIITESLDDPRGGGARDDCACAASPPQDGGMFLTHDTAAISYRAHSVPIPRKAHTAE